MLVISLNGTLTNYTVVFAPTGISPNLRLYQAHVRRGKVSSMPCRQILHPSKPGHALTIRGHSRPTAESVTRSVSPLVR